MANIESPFVSVLMPAYNVEPYIQKAIQSILDQTYTNFELIVSDDGSQDATVSVVSTFSDPRIVRILNVRNVGYAGNMNILFEAAKGQYLVIQDADDYCSDNRLQVLVDFLTTHLEIDLVGSSYVKINDQGEKTEISMPVEMTSIAQAFEQMADPLPVLNGTIMFRRAVIENGFLFRDLKYIRRGQDDDWLLRVSEHFKMANVVDYLYYYRSNASSMTQDPLQNTYYNIFAGEFVRFLRQYRATHGIDALEAGKVEETDRFFYDKKYQIIQQEPAYLELYIAHKYLGQNKRAKAMKWLLKGLVKDMFNPYIWKKAVYILWKKD